MSETNVQIFAAGKDWLKPEDARNYTSQFGEDGLIEKALAWIGETNRSCFEVGANDGDFFSNTKRLRNAGWRTLLIESETEPFAKLKAHASERVICVQQKIGRDSLDLLLSAHDFPCDLDLGVIDIDGQDYWAWEGMRNFRPRLMLVEFDEADSPAPPLDFGPSKQAGRTAIMAAGAEKGYLPLAATRVNLLMVRADVFYRPTR